MIPKFDNIKLLKLLKFLIIRSLKNKYSQNPIIHTFKSQANLTKTTKRTQLHLEIVPVVIDLIFNKVHRAIENLVLKRPSFMLGK